MVSRSHYHHQHPKRMVLDFACKRKCLESPNVEDSNRYLPGCDKLKKEKKYEEKKSIWYTTMSRIKRDVEIAVAGINIKEFCIDIDAI